MSGGRYTVHSPAIKVAVARCAIFAFAGGSAQALLPLVARDMLGGGAPTYGLLLGAFGAGAVVAGFDVPTITQIRERGLAARHALMIGVAIAVLALSRWLSLTVRRWWWPAAAGRLAVSLFNIGVQFSAPRWVAGRALAAFRTANNAGYGRRRLRVGPRRRCHQPRNRPAALGEA